MKASSKSHLSKGVLFDPWKEFKVYTFPKEGPLCVCREIVKFQFVMCTFNQLEHEVCKLLISLTIFSQESKMYVHTFCVLGSQDL